MSRLLFIFEEDMPTVSITRDVFTNLIHYPELISEFKYLFDVSREDIDTHDVIVFIRPANIYAWKIAKYAKDAGHTVLVFCDDDLLNLPGDTPMMPWRKKGLLKTLSFSDGIWSSSKYILEKYKSLTMGGRIIRINTIISLDELEGIEYSHNNSTTKIVYAAANSHASLFEKYIKPIVPELIKEFKEDVTFTFVGVHPDMPGIKCEYVSEMPLIEYRRYMRKQNFDIGLAPLREDDFTKCKYFNKFIEYTTQGIVGVYSNTEPYTYVVRDEKNGFLANNDPIDWLQSIRHAIKEKTLREKCVENAINYLRENHNEKTVISQLILDFPELLESPKEYDKCKPFGLQKVKHILSRPFDWLYLTGFYMKRNGIKDVVGRAKRRINGTNSYSRLRGERK